MSASVRAQWHLGDPVGDEDPFEAVTYSFGLEIDLTASEEELAATLLHLWHREERLYNQGLTCELKWAGQDCRTCPEATLDPEERRSVLCRLGKDQATVEAQHGTLREARLAPVRELAEAVDAAVDVLPDDLAELLALVGR